MISDERISELMRFDFSVGTDGFRDSLLAQCLAVLGEDIPEDCDGSAFYAMADPIGRNLSDDEIDMLSAAGSPFPRPDADDDNLL